ncbi:hypothetical protein CWI42_011320 [Ordospora colligata]|uniref:Uncharacterized protein n=1 Tax=Ordospora colligata OC4 TaxID=1354746 RepID=A0A0B2UM89_9MICR|nr:uncharacterized protein M896_011320 [Ordospora colligata OC4]KHN70478.1 hypothetical protein M896_011320 [Ordospora colligata OC4]TBU19658.1 hypothetical protein CWI42_011320 [Ordospora colligata]
MSDQTLGDVVESAKFAEGELTMILDEITLQNEKLVEIQRKIGIGRTHLVKNSRLLNDIFKMTRPILAIGLIVFSLVVVVIVYIRLPSSIM